MATSRNYKQEGNVNTELALNIGGLTIDGYALSYTGEEVNNAIDAAFLALVGKLNTTEPNMNTVLTISDASPDIDRHGKEFRFKKLTEDNLGVDLHYYYDKLYKLTHLGQSGNDPIDVWRYRPLTVDVAKGSSSYEVTYALIIDSGKAPTKFDLKGETPASLTPHFTDAADNLVFDNGHYRQLIYNDYILIQKR